MPRVAKPEVAVVGGGVAGLTAAWRARDLGMRTVLYEATPRVGGVVETTRRGGFLAEHGPHSMRVRDERIERLLRAVGLGDRRRPVSASARKRWIARSGRTIPVPTGPIDFLGSPLLSPSARLRVLCEPLRSRTPPRPDESLGDYLLRAGLGREVVDVLVNAFVGGIYAGDPFRLSLRYAFPSVWELASESRSLLLGAIRRARSARREGNPRGASFSFVEGMGELPAALGSDLGEVVRTLAPVGAARRVGDRWRVESGGGGGREETFDAVIVAVPAHRIPGLEIESREAEPVRSELARAMGAQPHPPVTVITLGYRAADVGHPLDGFGVLVPAGEDGAVTGAIFPSSLFPGRAPEGHVAISAFLGGVRGPELARAPAAEQMERVESDLRTLLDVSGPPVFRHRVVQPRAIPQYDLRHGERLRAATRHEESHPGLLFAGSWRGGVSVEEAMLSGWEAAGRARDHYGSSGFERAPGRARTPGRVRGRGGGGRAPTGRGAEERAGRAGAQVGPSPEGGGRIRDRDSRVPSP